VQKVTSQTLPRFKKNEVAFLLVTYDETANWVRFPSCIRCKRLEDSKVYFPVSDVILIASILQDFFYEIAEKYRETAAFGITTEPEIIKDLVPTYKEATTSVIVLFNDDDDREQFIVSSANQKVLYPMFALLFFAQRTMPSSFKLRAMRNISDLLRFLPNIEFSGTSR